MAKQMNLLSMFKKQSENNNEVKSDEPVVSTSAEKSDTLLDDVQKPPTKKLKSEPRLRPFQEYWKKEFAWLEVLGESGEERMFCKNIVYYLYILSCDVNTLFI